jgi:hypothetical protein
MQRPSLIALGLVLILVMSVGAWRVQAQDAEPDDVMIPQSLAGSAFTYQGRLTSGGAPVNGPCDFQFSLFDAASAGTQIGSTQPATNVSVMNGLFTVAIDFGGGAFNGAARWLEIGVRCPAGSGSYTTLSPRQALHRSAVCAGAAGTVDAAKRRQPQPDRRLQRQQRDQRRGRRDDRRGRIKRQRQPRDG